MNTIANSVFLMSTGACATLLTIYHRTGRIPGMIQDNPVQIVTVPSDPVIHKLTDVLASTISLSTSPTFLSIIAGSIATIGTGFIYTHRSFLMQSFKTFYNSEVIPILNRISTNTTDILQQQTANSEVLTTINTNVEDISVVSSRIETNVSTISQQQEVQSQVLNSLNSTATVVDSNVSEILSTQREQAPILTNIDSTTSSVHEEVSRLSNLYKDLRSEVTAIKQLATDGIPASEAITHQIKQTVREATSEISANFEQAQVSIVTAQSNANAQLASYHRQLQSHIADNNLQINNINSRLDRISDTVSDRFNRIDQNQSQHSASFDTINSSIKTMNTDLSQSINKVSSDVLQQGQQIKVSFDEFRLTITEGLTSFKITIDDLKIAVSEIIKNYSKMTSQFYDATLTSSQLLDRLSSLIADNAIISMSTFEQVLASSSLSPEARLSLYKAICNISTFQKAGMNPDALQQVTAQEMSVFYKLADTGLQSQLENVNTLSSSLGEQVSAISSTIEERDRSLSTVLLDTSELDAGIISSVSEQVVTAITPFLG